MNFLFFSGLIRATSNQNNRAALISIHSIDVRLEDNHRQSETVEEEKVQRDNSATEKQTVECFITPSNSFLSKSPSASNSIAVSETLFRNKKKIREDKDINKTQKYIHHRLQGSSIGDVMANKDGISICSNSSSVQINNQIDYDDDISTLTSTTDNKLNSICKF